MLEHWLSAIFWAEIKNLSSFLHQSHEGVAAWISCLMSTTRWLRNSFNKYSNVNGSRTPSYSACGCHQIQSLNKILKALVESSWRGCKKRCIQLTDHELPWTDLNPASLRIACGEATSFNIIGMSIIIGNLGISRMQNLPGKYLCSQIRSTML